MKKALFILLAGQVIFWSCETETFQPANKQDSTANNPDTVVLPDTSYLKFYVDPGYQNIPKWVFANDATGNLLDFGELNPGDTTALIFATPATGLADLTIIYDWYFTDPPFYELQTYKNVAVNRKVLIAQPYETGMNSIGSVEVTINNYDASDNPLDNLWICSGIFSGNAGVSNAEFSANNFSFTQQLECDPALVTISGYDGDNPVFFRKENVHPGDHISVDFNDFEILEKTQTMDFQGYSFIQGFRHDDPDHFHGYSGYFIFTSLPLLQGWDVAYADGFDSYRTVIADGRQTQLVYEKYGDPITSYARPAYTASIADHSIENFEAQFSLDYEYKEAQWNGHANEISITWNIVADSDTPLRLTMEIPEALLQELPPLNTDLMEYGQGWFYHTKGTHSYADLLDERLNLIFKPESEIYKINME